VARLADVGESRADDAGRIRKARCHETEKWRKVVEFAGVSVD